MSHIPGTSRYFVTFENCSALELGAEPGLDLICKGILEGEPFHFEINTGKREKGLCFGKS
jgi:hypothetical protein